MESNDKKATVRIVLPRRSIELQKRDAINWRFTLWKHNTVNPKLRAMRQAKP